MVDEYAADTGEEGGIKGALTRQIGPFPVWVWGVIIGGGFLAYKFLTTGSLFGSGSSTSTGASASNPSTDTTGGIDLTGLQDEINALQTQLGQTAGAGAGSGSTSGGSSSSGSGSSGSGGTTKPPVKPPVRPPVRPPLSNPITGPGGLAQHNPALLPPTIKKVVAGLHTTTSVLHPPSTTSGSIRPPLYPSVPKSIPSLGTSTKTGVYVQ